MSYNVFLCHTWMASHHLYFRRRATAAIYPNDPFCMFWMHSCVLYLYLSVEKRWATANNTAQKEKRARPRSSCAGN